MKKKCACCGNFTLEKDSLFDICDICGWENDEVQEENPDFSGGANDMSLNQYKEFYFCTAPEIKNTILSNEAIKDIFEKIKFSTHIFPYEWIRQYRYLLKNKAQVPIHKEEKEYYFNLFNCTKKLCVFLLSRYPNHESVELWINGAKEIEDILLMF